MKPETRGVIDIGTNSVKLLVAELSGERVTPVLEESKQTRLGSGFYETHQLQPQAIERTAEVVALFAERARQCAGITPLVIATSAARDAINREELLETIRRASGLETRVISGEQEAEWVFKGVATDPALAHRSLLILDVGGGSTEFIVGAQGHHVFRQSFAMGSVRLLEKLQPRDPPTLMDLAGCRGWLHEFFSREVTPAIKSFLSGPDGPPRLVGTGGTATIMARLEASLGQFDREAIERVVLRRQKVLDWMVTLWTLSLAERRRLAGLPAKRADIILTGVAIFEAVMEHLNVEELRVSTRGLRFGAVLNG